MKTPGRALFGWDSTFVLVSTNDESTNGAVSLRLYQFKAGGSATHSGCPGIGTCASAIADTSSLVEDYWLRLGLSWFGVDFCSGESDEQQNGGQQKSLPRQDAAEVYPAAASTAFAA